MKSISFARTTEAVKARRKRVTRREWKDSHAEKFKPGELVEALDKDRRYGGKPFGIVKIVSVVKEKTCLIPESDWEEEGFAYMVENGLLVGKDMDCTKLWRLWRQDREKETWVVRFDVVEIYGEVAA